MDTAQRYEFFAEYEAGGHSPCYENWCHEIACDKGVLGLIEQLPPEKRQPNLVLGAARYLGVEPSDYRSFRNWLTDHWTHVVEVALRRRTQTNEPGRTAVLLPVLTQIPGPLSLIEVGASAGLCLYPDRYSYRYDDEVNIDPTDGVSTVVLPCTTSGNPPLPARLPTVTSRVGVDVNPLDVNDPDDVRWLECLVWPEQHHRLRRLRAAVAIARFDAPRLVVGDLLDSVAELVDAAPSATTVVVFGSAVLSYLAPDARRVFESTVRVLDCRWIANEGTGVIESVAARLPEPLGGSRGRFVVSLDGQPLAYAGAHGQTLDWINQTDQGTK
ncbi:DUF2332 domain-containing protein [Nocardia otitidiscaviarum]|uniref:DUF2332 domain-containing protein n=1 Tax=Nocardia otitidiscaviarum TaxID=1823 RepID=A0A516NP95_9NOCA|nr:DUF2332 domain-containing protein [Nocardia otitidiscaviarum]MCP9624043.1 DUF2332 domain-containing protein [Nocardia otitidiscaviarum]QDP80695.1 DUF2332 domain-containing protein [Nocardia otitidiscaviarum]